MNIKEFRIELIKKERTALWVAQQLGYSPAYMYRLIADRNEKQEEKIKKILSEVK